MKKPEVGDKIKWAVDVISDTFEILSGRDSTQLNVRNIRTGITYPYVVKVLFDKIKKGEVLYCNDDATSTPNKWSCELSVMMNLGCQCGGA